MGDAFVFLFALLILAVAVRSCYLAVELIGDWWRISRIKRAWKAPKVTATNYDDSYRPENEWPMR